MEQFLVIGQVLRPHGVKGDVKVRVLSDVKDRFRGLRHIYMKLNDVYERRHIVSVLGEGDQTIVRLEGVSSRDAAEALRAQYIYVNREDAIPLQKDSYFICDLIGCAVADTEGDELGTLTDIMQSGAADVYVVQKDGRELLFPALKRLLVKVDIENRRIVVDAGVLKEVADI
ncbi:MAG: ribosome maturation factor RimM [Bacillota bacterium]